MLTTANITDDATLKKSISFCDEQGVTNVSDMVKFDLDDDFVRHLGLRNVPGMRLRGMLQPATFRLAGQLSDCLAISDPVTPPPPPQTLAKSLATSRFVNIYNQPERRPDQLYALMTTERHRAPLSATHRYGLPERSSGRMLMRVSAPCACM